MTGIRVESKNLLYCLWPQAFHNGFQKAAHFYTDVNISFKITQIPCGNQKECPVAYLEGRLIISLGEKTFFRQENILLIELALCIDQWLRDVSTETPVDFQYESMDNEDRILSFSYAGKGRYNVASIWQEVTIAKTVDLTTIITAFRTFLEEFTSALKSTADIDLSTFLNTREH